MKWSECLRNRVSIIIRIYIYIYITYEVLLLLSYSFGSILNLCMYSCMFCMLLFNFCVMYSYCYICSVLFIVFHSVVLCIVSV